MRFMGGKEGHRLFRVTFGQRLGMASGVALAYVLTLPASLAAFGDAAVDLVALPVAAIAATFGTIAGVVAAPVALGALHALLPVLGYESGWVLSVPHLVLALALAAGFGRMHDFLGSARWQAEMLRRSDATLRTVLANAPVVLWSVDAAGRFTLREGKALAALGLRPGQGVGQDAREFWRSEFAEGPGLPEELDRALAGEMRRSRLRARGRTLDYTLSPVQDAEGKITGVVGVTVDVTERDAAERDLEHLALYDRLTGLPNRTLFGDRCGLALAAAARDKTTLAVLIADLDNFADVNVTLGNEAGDATLREAGARLLSVVRDVDTVGRIGGDDFGMVLAGANLAAATEVARRALIALRRPLTVRGKELELSASIGIALWPQDAPDRETLIGRAELAMYRAKREHAGYGVYGAQTDGPSVEDIELAGDVRRAIDRREIDLAFQPEVRLSDGALLRMEALARWTHPVLGPIAPERLVRIAERAGHLPDLTRLVLDRALGEVMRWRALGSPTAQVAVNLAACDLADDELEGWIAELLRRHGATPCALGLEVTETALVTDIDRVAPRLRALRALGLCIAIDDFGTGYSSLSYLDRLPANDVKIDRSFVSRMTTDVAAASIVRATIGLGHDLGLTVVAEGVETAEQLALLRTMGCDAVQGYLISRPLSAAEAIHWLREHRPVVGPAAEPTDKEKKTLGVDDDVQLVNAS